MRIYLNAGFDDKDTVKGAGARWDSNKRKWFVKLPLTKQRFNAVYWFLPPQFRKDGYAGLPDDKKTGGGKHAKA